MTRRLPAKNAPKPAQLDFLVENHGSICILQPLTADAHQWVEDNIAQNEETQYWAGGIVVEPRYMGPILVGIANDGLVVR